MQTIESSRVRCDEPGCRERTFGQVVSHPNTIFYKGVGGGFCL